MRAFRIAAASALLLTTTLTAIPAAAQQGGSNGCTQDATSTGGGAGAEQRGGRSQSGALLIGAIVAAVQNVSVLSDLAVAVDALDATNVSVVCLNDVLNGNDIRILQDILNQSPILSESLNDNEVLNDSLNNLLRNADISLLNNVEIVSVDIATGTIYVIES